MGNIGAEMHEFIINAVDFFAVLLKKFILFLLSGFAAGAACIEKQRFHARKVIGFAFVFDFRAGKNRFVLLNQLRLPDKQRLDIGRECFDGFFETLQE